MSNGWKLNLRGWDTFFFFANTLGQTTVSGILYLVEV